MSISLAVTSATATKVTTLMTSCLTSVWILTSVWKADLIATRALTLREGKKTSAAKFFYSFFRDFFFSFYTICLSLSRCLFSLDSLAVSLSPTLHVFEFGGKQLRCDEPMRAVKESEIAEKDCQTTVNPRFNKPLYNGVLGITNDILRPSNSEYVLPVPWPFFISRLNCNWLPP